MAVDLPPPLPPQQAELSQVQRGEALSVIPFQQYQIHVMGARVLDDAALAATVAGADTLSNAVRALAAAYFAAGYPAAQLSYALSGQDLFVLATLGGISSVKAGEPLGKYFEGLNGVTPLTDESLEPRRLLATMHADRAGINAQPLLIADGSGGYAFDLKPDKIPADPTQVRVEYGNPGNRFVARHFLDLDLRGGTWYGDELRALTRAGLRGLNEKPGDDYFEQNLGWNRVTQWGVFGIGGRYVDYTVDNPSPATPQNGNIWVGEGYWVYPWEADFDSRIMSLLKVDRTSKSTEQTGALGAMTRIQHELYTSVEAGGTVSQAFQLLAHRWDFDGGLAARVGLGDGSSATNPVDFNYVLYRPTARLKVYFTETVLTTLEASAQITSDTVPEQQQFVLGGFGSLTSYLPGVAIGDTGYLVRLIGEAGTYPLYGVEFKPKVFVETGGVRFENTPQAGPVPTPAEAERQATPMLTDIGVELGVKLLGFVDAAVAYAESMAESDVADGTLRGSDANVYFRVAVKF
ncbi:MAG TPA: hypothetical protein VM074_12140 [Solimonas sp.]|nr:hypothetical protein [Solimonas sp.]